MTYLEYFLIEKTWLLCHNFKKLFLDLTYMRGKTVLLKGQKIRKAGGKYDFIQRLV